MCVWRTLSQTVVELFGLLQKRGRMYDIAKWALASSDEDLVKEAGNVLFEHSIDDFSNQAKPFVLLLWVVAVKPVGVGMVRCHRG